MHDFAPTVNDSKRQCHDEKFDYQTAEIPSVSKAYQQHICTKTADKNTRKETPNKPMRFP